MRFLARILFFATLISASARLLPAQVSGGATGWLTILHEQLPLLGHRNWIVVADSAYPAQTSPGIQTVESGDDQIEVLKTVLTEIDRSRHVRAIVFTDRELAFLNDKNAPGVSTFRDRLTKLVHPRGTQSLLHESLIGMLDTDSKSFRVLLIKTNSTVPYTTVFLKLDCAYWNSDEENDLRQRMGAEHTP